MKLKTFIILAVFSLTAAQAHAALKISCSMFPVYDFARAVSGGLAEVRLILKPGTEPHEFEPSPLDIKAVNDSDVFIFTGKLMEHWAERISGTLTHTQVIDASENIQLVNNDPHVWLDLSLAQKMIQNIAAGLSSADPENSQAYSRSAESYCTRLSELDAKFLSLPKTETLVFAGEFSCGYFLRHCGFAYVSAYDGENEPGVRRMAEIIRHIRGSHTRYILSDLPVSRVTKSISEQTGAEILSFSTAHSVGDISQTFLEIMTQNYENLLRILND